MKLAALLLAAAAPALASAFFVAPSSAVSRAPAVRSSRSQQGTLRMVVIDELKFDKALVSASID
jgi:cytochrome c556